MNEDAPGGSVESAAGPYFEELELGDVFDAPRITLTSGHAALHQAILGDRLCLPLDEPLAAEVAGVAPMAHPALVWDVAIGQSTVVTQHVKANLFYRGFVFQRVPAIGDSLRTRTEVVGLRQNRAKPGRQPTGLAALRIRTVDQHERPVLDFWRCAMLPLRADVATGRRDDLDGIGHEPASAELAAVVAGWRLERFRDEVPGPHFDEVEPGQRWRVVGADLVSQATELARMTLNVAAVHHDDAAAGGRRLVYGGHTIGLAFSQVCRAIPTIVTVCGWSECDHLGPVYEEDSLLTEVLVEGKEPIPDGGGIVRLRATVDARTDAGAALRPVLRWRFAVVLG